VDWGERPPSWGKAPDDGDRGLPTRERDLPTRERGLPAELSPAGAVDISPDREVREGKVRSTPSPAGTAGGGRRRSCRPCGTCLPGRRHGGETRNELRGRGTRAQCRAAPQGRPVPCRTGPERPRASRQAKRGGSLLPLQSSDSSGRTAYFLTSKSLVPADVPSAVISTWYLPTGQPDSLEMWNSLTAGPVGAMFRSSSLTTWPASPNAAEERTAGSDPGESSPRMG
jgi:hypothetical protein